MYRKFPSNLRFHYYVRDTDYRAKVVCQWPPGRRESLRDLPFSCLPLNELHIRRDRSILYLCRAVGGVGGNVAWAQLKFPTIECRCKDQTSESKTNRKVMVIFHCTFLALRSYDAARQTREIFDHELKDETRVFAAYAI